LFFVGSLLKVFCLQYRGAGVGCVVWRSASRAGGPSAAESGSTAWKPRAPGRAHGAYPWRRQRDHGGDVAGRVEQHGVGGDLHCGARRADQRDRAAVLRRVGGQPAHSLPDGQPLPHGGLPRAKELQAERAAL